MTIIAVDGVAASGKGTISEMLAKKYGFDYLDTGKIYRAVGLYVLDNNIPFEEDSVVAAIAKIDFEKQFAKDLNLDNIGDAASKCAKFLGVREALVDYQRNFPKGKKGAVVDGRDIGTVIFPNSDIKLYITADLEVRASRRYKQLQSKGINVSYDNVLADLKGRDERDISRKNSPTIPANDAVIVDTTNLNVKEVFELCCKLCDGVISF
jgi:cytidylate kinase